ncbi:MAG: hybrid sensor histidine kinase/response regulator, partial [Nitrospirota bacterium]
MNKEPIRVLLVEDSAADARFVKELLDASDIIQYRLVHVDRLGKALETLSKDRYDIVLADLTLPDEQGL